MAQDDDQNLDYSY